MQPLLEMPAGAAMLFFVVILAAAAFELIVSAVLALTVDHGTLIGLIIAVSTVPTFAIVLLVIPVRYQVWAQQLSIVFLLGRHWHVPYSTIESAEETRGFRRYGGSSVRFATAPSQAILLKRRDRSLRRPNIVISPQDRSVFLPRLQQAIAANPEASGARVGNG